MEKTQDAILVVSFGTSYAEARERCIGGVEDRIRQAFPGCTVARAFTSGVKMCIRDRRMLGAQTALCVDIPEERQLPRLVDRADLLTDQEEADLLARLDEISQRRQCDVAVVTVETLEGKTARAYADDFYDANGYGMGSGDDGILLLVCMGSRDWWITTYGLGTDAMTDAALDYVSQSFLPDLSSGNYSGAFTTFATLSDRVIGMALEGQPFREEDIPEPYAWWYILSLIHI